MPASPTTAYSRSDLLSSQGQQIDRESEALALQLLVQKRARQRDLQHDVAVKATRMLAELGNQARAADLDLLVTFLELAAAEAERERCRWGDAAG